MIHDGKGDHWVEDLNPPPPNPMFPFEDLDFVAAHPRFVANLLEQLSIEEEYHVEESDVDKSDVEEADVEDSDNEDFYTDDSESSVYSEIEDHYMFLDEDIGESGDVGVPLISIDISKITDVIEHKKESFLAPKKRAREDEVEMEFRYSLTCRRSFDCWMREVINNVCRSLNQPDAEGSKKRAREDDEEDKKERQSQLLKWYAESDEESDITDEE
ncbi:hypothetical protein NQZ68_016271 [Dissostichus eleginoides]|nr:hypothetical protein NQZ68_016271 [Dissostichus eleginoides]